MSGASTRSEQISSRYLSTDAGEDAGSLSTATAALLLGVLGALLLRTFA